MLQKILNGPHRSTFFVAQKFKSPKFENQYGRHVSIYFLQQTNISYIIRFTVASDIIHVLSSPQKHLIIFNELRSNVSLGIVRQYRDDATINLIANIVVQRKKDSICLLCKLAAIAFWLCRAE